jgi:hypothetical protein
MARAVDQELTQLARALFPATERHPWPARVTYDAAAGGDFRLEGGPHRGREREPEGGDYIGDDRVGAARSLEGMHYLEVRAVAKRLVAMYGVALALTRARRASEEHPTSEGRRRWQEIYGAILEPNDAGGSHA